MKILLNAMMRTRSKWMCINLHKYLKQLGPTADIKVNNEIWPMTDLFTNTNDADLLIKSSTDIITESLNRIDLLKNLDQNASIKIHPNSLRELLAIEEVKKFSDHYIVLCRKDIIDQSFSAILSMISKQWEPTECQKTIIKSYNEQPITVDKNHWIKVITEMVNTNKYLIKESTNIIYMEDTLSIRDTKDFCDMVKLPYVEFELNNRFDIEFGNFKKNMIANYNELLYSIQDIIPP